ncbi:unnamed protein product [Dracunculus medinensis]|uniref:Proteasome activator complex subunit 3 n=1 Tax=Dracunculus medinensis TaxID=318479 RepID=A0A0N4U1T5_DRAME|nr:unnamed protein product [Dracunculus medinensis]
MKASKNHKNSAEDLLIEYKKQVIRDAEKLVLEEFPKKSEQFSYDRLEEIVPKGHISIPLPDELQSQENNVCHFSFPLCTPVFEFVGGVVKCNEKLAVLTDIMRPLLRDAVESVNRVKLWILFLIPRIEDGNNFGVSIQEDTLSEVRTVEGEAASFLDQLSRYFVNRARLVTKVAKYPHVEDYRRAILDMDEKQFTNIRLVLTEMRNHFATLHDMITKNLEKIKTPRNNNAEHMY